jgi:hypothetical protein
MHFMIFDESLYELVKRQYGAVARWQLLERGLSERQIDRRVSHGRVHVLARGIYTVIGITPSWEQQAVAAWLASADRRYPAVLSHQTAAALYDIPGFGREGCPQLIAAEGDRHTNPIGFVVRRNDLRADDVTIHESGAHLTTPVRTTLDLLMADARPGRSRLLLDRALTTKLVTVEELRQRFQPMADANRPGVAHIRHLLAA